MVSVITWSFLSTQTRNKNALNHPKVRSLPAVSKLICNVDPGQSQGIADVSVMSLYFSACSLFWRCYPHPILSGAIEALPDALEVLITK